MKFRLNNKVIITEFDRCFSEKDYKNKIATIIDTDRIKRGYSNHWDYEVEFENGLTYVYADNELKLVHKYPQLLFDFVK